MKTLRVVETANTPARFPARRTMIRSMRGAMALGALTLLLGTPTPGAAQSGEEAAVLAVVQQFFDAIAAKDPALGAEAVLPDARFQGLRERPDGTLPAQGSSGADFLARLETMQGQMLERMWSPDVQIRGRLATVWARYDFHIDGAFSHCGVDAFSLIRGDTGWRIAAIVWTVEPDGCEPSPLGPPG